MDMYDIIEKKKNAEELTDDEIRFFIKGVTSGDIPDYQTAALLMAICLNKMSDRETFTLTDAMLHSGDVIDLSGIKGLKVDKHSTGGVGDKTTLVLGPMLAACGMKLAKMSGRGLGHTGGTIDKLESFTGLTTELSEERFIANVNSCGIAVAGQTADIAPADKKLYALRDVTATVNNVSLIASSIMSKKLASGAEAIVLDVKTGSGSFMDTYPKAKELAEKMVEIGTAAGKKVCAVISDMNQPLGHAVGNALEVKEAIAALHGEGPDDLTELCYALGAALMQTCGLTADKYEAKKQLAEAVSSGRAYEVFRRMIAAQGGDARQADDPGLLPEAAYMREVPAATAGYVCRIECAEIGLASLHTGAGREVKGAPIDPAAGIMIHKKIGDRAEKGESLATVYASSPDKLTPAAARISAAYTLGETRPEVPPLIYDIIQR